MLLASQLDDGGWADAGSTAELNTSVETYLALKIAMRRQAGTLAGSLGESLRRAVTRIQQLGGPDACTGETRLLLALFGQISFADVPSTRALRGGTKAKRSSGAASRSRESITAAIFGGRGATNATIDYCTVYGLLRRFGTSVSLEAEEGIRECFVSRPKRRSPAVLAGARKRLSGLMRRCRRKSRRDGSTLRCVLRGLPGTRWDVEDPPTAAELFRVALLLHAAGRSEGPAWRRCWTALSRLSVEDESNGGFFFRRGGSELRETADALRVLGEAGLTTRHPALLEAAEGLVSRADRWDALDDETRLAVLDALKSLFDSRSDALPPTVLLVNEQTARQGPADRSRRSDSLLEESMPLIAAHLERLLKSAKIRQWNAVRGGCVLELLGRLGVPRTTPFVGRLIRHLARMQNRDGSFGDAAGQRSLQGSLETTARVIVGLRSVGAHVDDPVIAGALGWLRLWQGERGAWRSPDNATTARSELSVTATAAALSAILSCTSKCEHEVLQRGVDFLLESQRPDGAWGATPDAGPDMAATQAVLVALSRYAIFASSLPENETPPALRVVRAEEEDEEETPHLSLAR